MPVLQAQRMEDIPASAPAARRFRPELQGLRALAVVLVVVYHVWLDRVSGGVDVFFVITGFLITGQLVRACGRGGVEFRPMWGRMIKRLFPAALLVLSVTMAVAVLLLPEHRWFQAVREIVASALYVENWQLAADSVDYFAQHNTASVVQHFWSLSIQGQFYVVWPLFVVAVAWGARRLGWGLRRVLFLALALIFVMSLGFSVWLTGVDQPLAYFHSGTRVWEFALGGMLALAIDVVVLPRAVAVLLGWVGVVALAACGLVLQVGSVFPGFAALWPTMAAVFVLVAGATGSRVGADRWLSSRPLAYVGNLSYALYLWHWPVLLFYLLGRDQQQVGWRGGAVVISVSLVLSILTYHFVEKPVRESRIGVHTRWGAYRLGVATLVPVLVAAGGWQFVSTQRASFAHELGDPDHPGVQALVAGGPILNLERSVIPPFAALPDEYSNFTSATECRTSSHHEELLVCSVGPAATPTRRVVVVGDSHAQQVVAAFRPSTQNRNWQITAMLRGGCPLTATAADPGCAAWNDAVLEEIMEMRPDAVVAMATRDVRVGLKERTPEGYVEQWRRLADAGIPVIAVRDNPRFDFSPPDCVQTYGFDAVRCGRPRAELLAPEPPYAKVPDLPGKVSFLDTGDYYCTADFCPPVIGNVFVYLDNNHVTKTYMETLSPMFEHHLVDALDWHDDPAPPAGSTSSNTAPPR